MGTIKGRVRDYYTSYAFLDAASYSGKKLDWVDLTQEAVDSVPPSVCRVVPLKLLLISLLLFELAESHAAFLAGPSPNG